MSATVDEIVGTAVLGPENVPIQWLYYVRSAAKAEGKLACGDLPVMRIGGLPPSVPLPAWFPENRPWHYSIVGDTLHVKPSVQVKDFHNGASWSVKFVRACSGSAADCYRQLAEVNPDLDIKESCERNAAGYET